jgi:hypothetical protein
MTISTIAFKTSIQIYHVIWRNIPEESSLHSHRLGNPESCSLVIVKIQWFSCVTAQIEWRWTVGSSRDWVEDPRERIVALTFKKTSEGMNGDTGCICICMFFKQKYFLIISYSLSPIFIYIASFIFLVTFFSNSLNFVYLYLLIPTFRFHSWLLVLQGFYKWVRVF